MSWIALGERSTVSEWAPPLAGLRRVAALPVSVTGSEVNRVAVFELRCGASSRRPAFWAAQESPCFLA